MSRLAIYPGSFDPPTLGHMDVLERAARLFERVVVAVGVNPTKQALLSQEERQRALIGATCGLANVEVGAFEGLLVEYARSLGATAIVRGLRATSDFDYEFQIAITNRRLAPEIETVFLMTKWEHSFLSSSVVREVAQLGGDYAQFVPPAVAAVLAERLAGG
jgi:pantetheine-phosphate adenylyltransferase